MLVPWSGRAGCEIDDTDNRLLDGFTLTFQVFSKYLGEPWRCLRLCPGDRWHIWKRSCRSGEVKKFTADQFHVLPREFLGGCGPSSCYVLRIPNEPRARAKIPGVDPPDTGC